MNGKRIYRTYIELNTSEEVTEFANICSAIPSEVMVRGYEVNKWQG